MSNINKNMPLFRPSNVPLIATVQTADCELSFEIDSRYKIRELIEMVCSTLSVKEKQFFGLCKPPEPNTHPNIKTSNNSSSRLSQRSKNSNESLSSNSSKNTFNLSRSETSLSDIFWLDNSRKLSDYSFINSQLNSPVNLKSSESDCSNNFTDKTFCSSSKRKAKNLPVVRLDFRIRFYPESIDEQIYQLATQRLLFLQIRDQILKGSLPLASDEAEDAILLSAYSCQVFNGNFDQRNFIYETGQIDYLAIFNYLTNNGQVRLVSEKIEKLFKSHNNLDGGQANEWIIRLTHFIVERLANLTGLITEEAILEYLKKAETIEAYGFAYWAVSCESSKFQKRQPSLTGNRTNSVSVSHSLMNLNQLKKAKHSTQNIWFGVNQKGISLYDWNDNERQKALVAWSWSRIYATEFSGRKVVVKIKGDDMFGGKGRKLESFTFHVHSEDCCISVSRVWFTLVEVFLI